MVNSGMKKIVIIKDIPSNLIEEAILILKNEPGTITGESKLKNNSNARKAREHFLYKEAELIINNYINESRMEGGRGIGRGKRRNILRSKFFVGLVINLVLIGSVALFVYLLLQLL